MLLYHCNFVFHLPEPVGEPGLCLVFGLRDGGGGRVGGYGSKKKFAYLKWASHFAALDSDFILP